MNIANANNNNNNNNNNDNNDNNNNNVFVGQLLLKIYSLNDTFDREQLPVVVKTRS